MTDARADARGDMMGDEEGKSPFWKSVDQAAKTVSAWPEWKRAGVVSRPARRGGVMEPDTTTNAQHCDHDWHPFEGWRGRYRCASCFCLGFKGAAVHGKYNGPPIRPYVCHHKGCSGPATGKRRDKPRWKMLFCRHHRGEI